MAFTMADPRMRFVDFADVFPAGRQQKLRITFTMETSLFMHFNAF